MCAFSIVAALVTDTEMGTSCSVCSRFCAVTMTCWASSAAALAGAVAGAAACASALPVARTSSETTPI